MTLTDQRERRELAQRAPTQAATLEDVLIKGDLKSLTDEQRVSYYNRLCEITGLNPLAQPFAYIVLNGKLTLYALRSATDQLRAVHGVSVTDMDKMTEDGVHIVTVKVQDAKGRTDMATGAVSIGSLKGEALANALMKAETKAKRRATLSICGLGLLDETEVETIPTARPLTPASAQTPVVGEPSLSDHTPRRTNVVVNEKTGREIDTENARNQRPEWHKFTDQVQGFVDARDADGLKLWFTGEKVAAYVAGWVFKDEANEHFDAALERIEEMERT